MTLFIHISDLHFRENHFVTDEKLEALKNSIIKHNPDKVIFLFGGDLAQSGSLKEYEAFFEFYKKTISIIESKIKSKVFSFFTPGNHDLKYLPNENRTRKDILKLTQTDLAQQYREEVKRIKSYEEFSNSIYLSQADGSIEELKSEDSHFYRHFQILVENDVIVDIFCMNNALFSFYDKEDEFYDNDSGALRLPIDKLKYVSKRGNIGFLLMHFPLEFFEFNSRKKIQYRIERYFDVVLTGHIHNEESNQSLYSNKKVCNIKTGIFKENSSDESSFNVLKLDKSELSVYNYKWNIQHSFYDEKLIHESYIETRNIVLSGISLKDEFIKSFFYDSVNLKNSILDCFMFPNMISTNIYDENEQEKISDIDALMDVIYYHDKIVIEGDDGSGKSTLVKYLFKEFSKEYLVLYIDETSLIKNRPSDKMVQELFLNQYDATSLNQFFNYDISKRILFVDNVENNKRALESIKKYFSKTIVTTSRNYKKSIIDLIKEELDDEENGIVLEIKGFYKTNRSYFNEINL